METVARENLRTLPVGAPIAECIKLTGRSDVFIAKLVNCSRNGLILVSRKAVKPGTNLIIRFKTLPFRQIEQNTANLRVAGLAEVNWVEEIIDSEGLAYALGVNYIYTD